jgi:hypothetical protein
MEVREPFPNHFWDGVWAGRWLASSLSFAFSLALSFSLALTLTLAVAFSFSLAFSFARLDVGEITDGLDRFERLGAPVTA